MTDIETLAQRYVELAEFRVNVRVAFEPVLDWYQDKDERRPIPEMITEAVHDLQRDREENLILRRAIRNIVSECESHIRQECSEMVTQSAGTNFTHLRRAIEIGEQAANQRGDDKEKGRNRI